MKYLVSVSKEWTEHGEVIVDAPDVESAREMVTEMLTDGSDNIQWFGSNMDPGQECVESVIEHKPPPKQRKKR